jgi:hypothetical protein
LVEFDKVLVFEFGQILLGADGGVGFNEKVFDYLSVHEIFLIIVIFLHYICQFSLNLKLSPLDLIPPYELFKVLLSQ